MKFCIISPIVGLETYARLSNHHLVLAHMLHSKDYMDFYVHRRQAGDTLILDNGAYENTKPLDSNAYVNMIRNLDPQVVVLPDHLMSPWRITTSAALKFLDEWGPFFESRHYRTEWMFVPQTDKKDSNLRGWMKALEVVVNDGRVGKYIQWIGLGRYLATQFPRPWRVDLAKLVQDHFPHLKLHALGMAAGSVDELKELRDVGVTSIDSSAPVWRGWNLSSLVDTQNIEEWEQKGTPCDFFAKFPTENTHASGITAEHKIILSNLQEVGIDINQQIVR